MAKATASGTAAAKGVGRAAAPPPYYCVSILTPDDGETSATGGTGTLTANGIVNPAGTALEALLLCVDGSANWNPAVTVTAQNWTLSQPGLILGKAYVLKVYVPAGGAAAPLASDQAWFTA
jgi:hypothetical protein